MRPQTSARHYHYRDDEGDALGISMGGSNSDDIAALKAETSPLPRQHPQGKRPSFTLPRSFSISAASTSATPYIHAGLKELREMFDLDSPVIMPDEENLDALEASVDIRSNRVATKRSAEPTSTSAASQGCSLATNQTAPGGSSSLRPALVSSCLFWSTVFVWGLKQDSDLFSPALLAPLALPLPLSAIALFFVHRGDSSIYREGLDVVSKVYKAHILLQGLIGVIVWNTLGETAVYKDRHAGSLPNRAVFTMVTIAQAALPVASALCAQWWLACSIARCAKAIRPARPLSATPATSVLLPYAVRDSPQPTSPPASPMMAAPSSPRLTRTERANKRSRPSASATHTTKSHQHRRTVSQPVIPLGIFREASAATPHDRDHDGGDTMSRGLSSEAAFFAEPLLARGVRQGLVTPRRSRTWESPNRPRSTIVGSGGEPSKQLLD
ncbi:hypothetical protein BDZ90DRAFT_109284 [Jaminaea rosea]|uniref:Uncharacterized protein n=1 Tax=Jaminaea rosea TaxID=1569628 RepID=A0A316UXD8_9BASI|nr:hypothetical protein BDZ90DRAFT_109284 [Jaminaea rosea]PWN29438.1 hypothetical protein BDZ90DRAFT_109284 [Jaminaea rosea]